MTDAQRNACRNFLRTERVASVLRLAVGVLLVAMTIAFEPLAAWVAVTAAVTGIGWSLLMSLALQSRLSRDELVKLAAGSHWFDIVLALMVFVVFLPDPEATPVAALPLLVFRMTARHGVPGAIGGAGVFVSLIALRIAANRMVNGEALIRLPLLLAWALVATLVLILALEIGKRSAGEKPASAAADQEPAGVATGVMPASTGNERIVNLAACLSLKLDTTNNAASLTQREQQVLLMLGQDHTYSAVADGLYISAGTVRNHVHNIRNKLKLADREELLALAREVAACSAARGTASSPDSVDLG
ncbi:LuxR C-terminal-related transcriptional regulator [Streptomyces caeni]|uniref:LuxR C-terminal-related transcriptional regulator n=1 Tax=Streptomyces caeni TaxID=2307231 RepID=A0ABW4IR44_9ACTN